MSAHTMLTSLNKQSEPSILESDTDFGIYLEDVNEDYTQTNQNEGATLGHEKCELSYSEGEHVWQVGAIFMAVVSDAANSAGTMQSQSSPPPPPCDSKSTPAPWDPKSMPAACEAHNIVVESEEAHHECKNC